MIKFILLTVLFMAVSCEDDFEPTVNDLEALWALLPPSSRPVPIFAEILAKMTSLEKGQLKQWLSQVVSMESARARKQSLELSLEKGQLKQWLSQVVSMESARARKQSLEFGEKDMNVLRRLVEKKVPGWDTFLDEDGLPTEVGRLRLYKELGFHRVSK